MRALAVLGLVVALSGCAEAPAASPATAESATSDFHQLVADGATLLDVRTPGEYASGHLANAVLVPVDEVAARIDEIPRDRPVVVYCRSGRRSASAAATLRAGGYDVHDLGSIDNW